MVWASRIHWSCTVPAAGGPGRSAGETPRHPGPFQPQLWQQSSPNTSILPSIIHHSLIFCPSIHPSSTIHPFIYHLSILHLPCHSAVSPCNLTHKCLRVALCIVMNGQMHRESPSHARTLSPRQRVSTRTWLQSTQRAGLCADM